MSVPCQVRRRSRSASHADAPDDRSGRTGAEAGRWRDAPLVRLRSDDEISSAWSGHRAGGRRLASCGLPWWGSSSRIGLPRYRRAAARSHHKGRDVVGGVRSTTCFFRMASRLAHGREANDGIECVGTHLMTIGLARPIYSVWDSRLCCFRAVAANRLRPFNRRRRRRPRPPRPVLRSRPRPEQRT